MPDLSTIQGASLQPRGGEAFKALQEGIQTFRTRGLTETLAGTPSPEQEKEALVQLSTVNPEVARTVQGVLQRNDRLEQQALGREIRKGVELTARLAGKDFNGKRRLLMEEAQTTIANNGDPRRLMELLGKSEDELTTEIQRMQIAGTATETLLKRPQQQAALKVQEDARYASDVKSALQDPQRLAELRFIAQQNQEADKVNFIDSLQGLTPGQQEARLDDVIRQAPQAKPISVAKGATLIDPTTGQTVFQAPEAAKAPTPQTDLAKIQADINAGFITPAEGNAQKKILNATPTEFKSKVGKLIGDKTAAIGLFGKDSPQVKAIQAAIDGEQKGEKAKFSDVAGLRKEFTKESGDFIKVRDGINKVRNTNPDAAGDLAMIFNFMKVLDPGSTVREGEFANAQNSGSVSEKVWALYNQMLTGERLTPPQRKRFIAQAERTFTSTIETQKQLERQFAGIAKRNNVDPRDVIVDFKPKEEAAAPDVTVPAGQPEGTQFTGNRTEQGFPIFQRPDGSQFAVGK